MKKALRIVVVLGLMAAGMWWGFFRGMPNAKERAAPMSKAGKARVERAESEERERPGPRGSAIGDPRVVEGMRERMMSREPLGDIDLWDVVSTLTLAELRQLFAEPELFELEFGTLPPGDSAENLLPGAGYPRRAVLVPILWERLGLLSPQEAWDLAGERLQGNDRRHYGALLKGIAKNDPALAFDFMRGSASPFREDAVLIGPEATELFGVLTGSSPADALGVIAGLHDLSQNSAYLGYVKALPPDADWAGEVQRIESWGLSPGRASMHGFMESTSTLATRWASQDADAAFAWMAGALKDSAESSYGPVIQGWIRAEAEEALSWLEAWQPAGRDTQAIFCAVIQEDYMNDTASTDRVLALITDQEVRDDAVMQRLTRGGHRLSDQALVHLIRSPLISEEVRQTANAVLSGETVRSIEEQAAGEEAPAELLPDPR